MVEDQPTKTCTGCKADKPTKEFHKGKPACKKCTNASDAARHKAEREADPEAYKAYHAAYRAARREQLKAKAAAFRVRHPEKVKAQHVAYAKTHAKEVKAGQAAYYRANQEKHKAFYRAYRKANRERLNAKRAAYVKANAKKVKAVDAAYRASPKGRAKHAAWRARPEIKAYFRQKQQERRALEKKAAVGDLKLIAAWEKTWRTAKSVACHWCGKRFVGKDCHADHVVPLSKGGAHDRANLCIACSGCNQKKRAMLPADFNATLEQPLLFP